MYEFREGGTSTSMQKFIIGNIIYSYTGIEYCQRLYWIDGT